MVFFSTRKTAMAAAAFLSAGRCLWNEIGAFIKNAVVPERIRRMIPAIPAFRIFAIAAVIIMVITWLLPHQRLYGAHAPICKAHPDPPISCAVREGAACRWQAFSTDRSDSEDLADAVRARSSSDLRKVISPFFM